MIIRQRRSTYQWVHRFHSSCQFDAFHTSTGNRWWQQGSNLRHFDMVDCRMRTCLKTRAHLTILNSKAIINIPAVVETTVVVVYVPGSRVQMIASVGQAQRADEPKVKQVPPLMHSPSPHRPLGTWRAKRWSDAASTCANAITIAESVTTNKDEDLSMM